MKTVEKPPILINFKFGNIKYLAKQIFTLITCLSVNIFSVISLSFSKLFISPEFELSGIKLMYDIIDKSNIVIYIYIPFEDSIMFSFFSLFLDV